MTDGIPFKYTSLNKQGIQSNAIFYLHFGDSELASENNSVDGKIFLLVSKKNY